jgi:hypothetical protein
MQWEKASIRIFEGAEQILRINSVVNNHSSDQWSKSLQAQHEKE